MSKTPLGSLIEELLKFHSERVRVASKGNGSTKYLNQLKSYLRGEYRKNPRYLGGNMSTVTINIYLHNKNKNILQ